MSRKIQLTNALTLAIAAVAALEVKFAAASEKSSTLQSQVDNLDAIEALVVGDSIKIKVGRGDTRQEVVGTIRAIKAGEVAVVEATEEVEAYEVVGDRTFKVEFTRTGDEFDNEYAVVPESQVSLVVEETAAE
jgi:hypothetical protein